MATQARRALRLAGKALAWLALAVGLFFLAGWIGSSIPRNNGWREPDRGIEIMVETNGVHTGIVMPLVTPQKDWRDDFPANDLAAPGLAYTHVSVSWGEREVFVNTPTWSDLSPVTAVKAAVGGHPLIHAAHYVRPAPSANYRIIRLRPEEYRLLAAQVEAQLAPREDREVYSGYGQSDVFYDAQGSYHIGNTCNQWTSDTLAAAGIRTGWWTPFAGGVMKWVPHGLE